MPYQVFLDDRLSNKLRNNYYDATRDATQAEQSGNSQIGSQADVMKAALMFALHELEMEKKKLRLEVLGLRSAVLRMG